jgi:Fe-S cluster assembly iron-binding protein IscA
LALDEPKPRDTQVEESGITFLFDAKTATLVAELVINYDDSEGFYLYDESIPGSNC